MLVVMISGLMSCYSNDSVSTSSKNQNPPPDSDESSNIEAPLSLKAVNLNTSCGNIKGLQMPGYQLFKGIRYATADRWERAQIVTGWEGEYDATEFGAWAWQFKGFYHTEDSNVTKFYYDEATVHFPVAYSEDCLNLNIWKPNNAENSPVIIFIHGGGFVNGGNSDSYIDGEAYADKGVILVSINYRLGPFATIYGDGYTGSYQLTDQITAIQWIYDNIKDYGGDPSRITIMGESAGALSVQNILISPQSEGMISGAIMMSGGGDLSSLGTPTSPDKVELLWHRVKEKLSVDSLAELKDLSAKTVFDTWLKAYGELPEHAIASTAPIINGLDLPMNVKEALRHGKTANVPCIFGVLSEDMWPYTLYTSALQYGIEQDKAGKSPVYLYYFDRQLPGKNEFGAFHAADLWYAFGTLNRNWRPFDETDYRISNNMINYIVNFAHSGNPNSPDLVHWEPISDVSRLSLNFGEEEPTMMAPSLSDLMNTQNTKPAFPHK